MLQILQTWKGLLKQKVWLVILLLALLVVGALFVWFWRQSQQTEDKYHEAVVLQQRQLEQVEELSRALHISKMNAQELQAAYDELKAKPPVASFKVQAPSLERAAEAVKEKIDAKDSALTAAVLEKTDRTVVVANENAYKVEVLKINLDKAWEVSMGVGSHNGDVYLPVGVQKNYAAHKALAVEVHVDTGDLERGKIKTSGWEVKHVWRFN